MNAALIKYVFEIIYFQSMHSTLYLSGIVISISLWFKKKLLTVKFRWINENLKRVIYGDQFNQNLVLQIMKA